MTARVSTVAFQGIEVLDIDVQVQVQVAAGLPAFTIVGLPNKAVGESRDRVRARPALRRSRSGCTICAKSRARGRPRGRWKRRPPMVAIC